MFSKDLATLQLPASVELNLDDLKKTYRKLSMIYHPDKKPHGNAQTFDGITKAYNNLVSFLESSDKKKNNQETLITSLQEDIEQSEATLQELQASAEADSQSIENEKALLPALHWEVTRLQNARQLTGDKVNIHRCNMVDIQVDFFEKHYKLIKQLKRWQILHKNFIQKNGHLAQDELLEKIAEIKTKNPDSTVAKAYAAMVIDQQCLVLLNNEQLEIARLEAVLQQDKLAEKLAMKRIQEISTRSRNLNILKLKLKDAACSIQFKKNALQQEIESEMQAFKKIYMALRNGEGGFFKTNFLKKKALLTSIQLRLSVLAHVNEKPISRTAAAFYLAGIYAKRCTPDNMELLSEIMQKTSEKPGFFKRVQHIFSKPDVLDEASNGSQTSMRFIKSALTNE